MHCYACFPTTVTHLPPCSTQDAESKGDGNGKPLAHTHAADSAGPLSALSCIWNSAWQSGSFPSSSLFPALCSCPSPQHEI